MIDTISIRYAIAVTPSDTVPLFKPTRGLFIGTAGDVVVTLVGDEWNAPADIPGGMRQTTPVLPSVPVTFKNVAKGTILPIRVTKVMVATSALDILALY